MTIVVGLIKNGGQYIGRGSPLGNPFPMKNQTIGERNRVCDEYKKWLDEKIINNDPAIISELNRLYTLSLQGDLTLGCYCAPKRCHGDYIKQLLETHGS